jgi:putative aldouronate transport system permease protein
VLDGAGIFTLLTRIIAPLSLPVIATVGLWSVVYHWNEWFDAMIYAARRDLIVLQLLLRRILIENQAAEWLELASEETAVTALTEDTVKAATMFVSIGPIIIAYPFIQRYFVKGIMVGSLKG